MKIFELFIIIGIFFILTFWNISALIINDCWYIENMTANGTFYSNITLCPQPVTICSILQNVTCGGAPIDVKSGACNVTVFGVGVNYNCTYPSFTCIPQNFSYNYSFNYSNSYNYNYTTNCSQICNLTEKMRCEDINITGKVQNVVCPNMTCPNVTCASPCAQCPPFPTNEITSKINELKGSVDGGSPLIIIIVVIVMGIAIITVIWFVSREKESEPTNMPSF